MLKNFINRELKKANKSQAWMALFTGISTGMVSQFASGRSIPTPAELVSMRAALQCTNETLYPPESLAIILGASKPEQENGKKYHGKHVLLSDEIALEVDAYGRRRGISRNESSRVLIILGLAADAPRTVEAIESCGYDFFKELVKGEADHTSVTADHSGG